MALVIALAMMTVLSISVGAAVTYSMSNTQSSRQSKGRQLSSVLAEAGINNSVAVLTASGTDPMDPTLLPERTNSYEGGSVTWSGVLSGRMWTLTSIGKATNSNGPNMATHDRTITAQAEISYRDYQTATNTSWNWLFAYGTGSTCDMTLNGSVNLSAPLYVAGNLCLDGTAQISGSNTRLLVQDKVTLYQTANRIGTSTTSINEARIKNGCKWSTNLLHAPCRYGPGVVGNESTTDDNVWASNRTGSSPNQIIPNNPTTMTTPVPDWDYWYANSSPGPNYPCNSSSTGTLPTFDNNAARDNSVGTVWQLTPAGVSYDCRSSAGRLKWDHTTSVLTVYGVVFFDGSVAVSNATIDYNYWAAIYLSGTFMADNARLCSVVSSGTCSTSPFAFPFFGALLIVANGTGGQVPAGTSIQFKNGSFMQGLALGTGAIEVDASSSTHGPLIGQTLKLSGNIRSWSNFIWVPAGTPGNANTSKEVLGVTTFSS